MLLYESVFMNEQAYSAAYKFYGEKLIAEI